MLVFSKTNEKHSVSSKDCFLQLALMENVLLVLQSCTNEKATTLMHF